MRIFAYAIMVCFVLLCFRFGGICWGFAGLFWALFCAIAPRIAFTIAGVILGGIIGAIGGLIAALVILVPTGEVGLIFVIFTTVWAPPIGNAITILAYLVWIALTLLGAYLGGVFAWDFINAT